VFIGAKSSTPPLLRASSSPLLSHTTHKDLPTRGCRRFSRCFMFRIEHPLCSSLPSSLLCMNAACCSVCCLLNLNPVSFELQATACSLRVHPQQNLSGVCTRESVWRNLVGADKSEGAWCPGRAASRLRGCTYSSCVQVSRPSVYVDPQAGHIVPVG